MGQSSHTKRLIIENKVKATTVANKDDDAEPNIIDTIIDMLDKKNFEELKGLKKRDVPSKEIHNAVLSMLLQISKDDSENKRLVGDKFLKVAGERMEEINKFIIKRDSLAFYLETNQNEKAKEAKNISKCTKDILFETYEGCFDPIELKFFKLVASLLKNVSEN